MKKNQREFNLDAFNEIMSHVPAMDFRNKVIVTERVRKCAVCKYLAIDYSCAKCDCNFQKKISDLSKSCPLKYW